MTDIGGGGEGSVPATKALVFMVNCLNHRFKLTLAHFFVDNMSGRGKGGREKHVPYQGEGGGAELRRNKVCGNTKICKDTFIIL